MDGRVGCRERFPTGTLRVLASPFLTGRYSVYFNGSACAGPFTLPAASAAWMNCAHGAGKYQTKVWTGKSTLVAQSPVLVLK